MSVRMHAWRVTVAATVITAVVIVSLHASAPRAQACDLCAVYTATIMPDQKPGVWLGLNQQFTSFGTARDGTSKEANPSSEWIESSITQVALGWASGGRWGMQLNVPIVTRRYRRATDDDGIEKNDETGVGDASIVTHYDVLSDAYPRGVYVVRLLGGFKMATGDSDRLGAELEEHTDEDHEDDEDGDHHDASGVHDHDLALGSGSIDGMVGVSFLWTRDRFSLNSEIQYMLRSEGDFDYQYANDLTWSVAPGFYTALGHDYTLKFSARAGGETKGTDEQKGERVGDSGITTVYLGPLLTLTQGLGLHFDVGVDLPVYQNTSGLQLVPDYRVRLATSVRF